jgi:hypothetical protein
LAKSKVVTIERHPLSDGGAAEITRLGRTYNFNRTYDSLERAPDCEIGIPLRRARELLADTLRADVLEID